MGWIKSWNTREELRVGKKIHGIIVCKPVSYKPDLPWTCNLHMEFPEIKKIVKKHRVATEEEAKAWIENKIMEALHAQIK